MKKPLTGAGAQASGAGQRCLTRHARPSETQQHREQVSFFSHFFLRAHIFAH